MSTLHAEWIRLFIPADMANGDISTASLITPDGRVRAMVLELFKPAEWQPLSALWMAVQTELDFPAPAIAVSGTDAYQLWFSLAEPVSASQAHVFLEALRSRYLHAVSPLRIRTWPTIGHAQTPPEITHAPLVPALQEATQRWSAFVASDLAAVFAEEPWLEWAPSDAAQAGVLSRVRSIPADAFEALLAQWAYLSASPCPSPARASHSPRAVDDGALGLGPLQFLMEVMRDASVDLSLRVDAAKALLPYVEGKPRQ